VAGGREPERVGRFWAHSALFMSIRVLVSESVKEGRDVSEVFNETRGRQRSSTQ